MPLTSTHVDVYACQSLATRLKVVVNGFSFFKTFECVSLPILTMRVEVFMRPTISHLRHLIDSISCDETIRMVGPCATIFRCASKDFFYFNTLQRRYGGLLSGRQRDTKINMTKLYKF